MGAADRSVEEALADEGVRFLLDENVPSAFAAALRLVGYNAIANTEVNLRGAPDPEVIEFCGARRLVWVTKDQDARKRASYVTLVRDHRVSAVFIHHPRAKRWSMKEQFEVLVKHLRTLETRYGRATGPRHFVCQATGQPKEVASFGARTGR